MFTILIIWYKKMYFVIYVQKYIFLKEKEKLFTFLLCCIKNVF